MISLQEHLTNTAIAGALLEVPTPVKAVFYDCG